MRYRRFFFSSVFVGAAALGIAAPAVFKSSTGVVFYDGVSINRAAPRIASPAKQVSKVWGALPDGRAVVTLKHDHPDDADAVEGHSDEVAGPVALLDSSGNSAVISNVPDALRVFMAPTGSAMAIIAPSRDLVICRTSDSFVMLDATTVTAPGRVSHVAWSPDGTLIAAAVYPPDFTPHAMDNARNPEEFLRLQNADIYLFSATDGKLIRQVTSAPGTDYNPFFSPDGATLFYVSLHETDGSGGLVQVSAADATSSPTQVTSAGANEGKVPIGRVGTYLFSDADTLVFEAGVADGSGEIWRMKRDGSGARMLRKGRHPQPLSSGVFAVIDGDTPSVVSQEEVQK